MDTLIELSDRQALIKHCQGLLRPFGFKFKPETLEVEPYSLEPDTRIDWAQTYLVKIPGYGVMGFTDSAC